MNRSAGCSCGSRSRPSPAPRRGPRCRRCGPRMLSPESRFCRRWRRTPGRSPSYAGRRDRAYFASRRPATAHGTIASSLTCPAGSSSGWPKRIGRGGSPAAASPAGLGFLRHRGGAHDNNQRRPPPTRPTSCWSPFGAPSAHHVTLPAAGLVLVRAPGMSSLRSSLLTSSMMRAYERATASRPAAGTHSGLSSSVCLVTGDRMI